MQENFLNPDNNKTSDQQYWDNRWKTAQTGWDLQQASPPLREYINKLENKDLKILIPGCGNAYEAEYLVSKGFANVTLIDIAESIVTKLKQSAALKPIRILHGDFFNHNEKYDLILEQTFFCAINPAKREQYVFHSYNILNENGRIAGLLFDTIFENPGPPFGGSREEYNILFHSLFELKKFEASNNSIESRLGKELFVEMQRKEMKDSALLFCSVTGITDNNEKNSVIEKLLAVNGVKFVSINADFSNVLILKNRSIPYKLLSDTISADSKYIIKEISESITI